MTHFKKTIKSYFLKCLIKVFDLIPNMALNTGWPLITPFKGMVKVGDEYASLKS